MIMDGGGYNQYLAAEMFEGRVGKEVFEGPEWTRLAMSTFPLRMPKQPGYLGQQDPELVYDPAKAWDPKTGYDWMTTTPTDSGAAATALATGQKTYKHSLCMTDFARAMRNANDDFRMAGKSVGVVTSVEWSDATPAAMIAHNVNRDNRVQVAREMIDRSGATVIMGACHPWYDGAGMRRDKMGDASWVGEGEIFTKPGKTWNGIRLIETKGDFERLANGKLDLMGCRRLVGTAQVADGLQVSRPTRDWNGDGKVDGEDTKVAPAYGDPLLRNTPSLATMAKGALRLVAKNPNGFFLMIEGGAVDHAGHYNWGGRMIEEAHDFFRAIETVSDWVEHHGGWEKNLVIVTGDHETGNVHGPESDRVPFQALVDRGRGKMPGFRFNSTQHSNCLIPFFARGAGAEAFAGFAKGTDPFRGRYFDNAQVYEGIRPSARRR
jgi:alkaline phosphatase